MAFFLVNAAPSAFGGEARAATPLGVSPDDARGRKAQTGTRPPQPEGPARGGGESFWGWFPEGSKSIRRANGQGKK
jgi:hypothetical protein